jgi:hypothetical protein
MLPVHQATVLLILANDGLSTWTTLRKEFKRITPKDQHHKFGESLARLVMNGKVEPDLGPRRNKYRISF